MTDDAHKEFKIFRTSFDGEPENDTDAIEHWNQKLEAEKQLADLIHADSFKSVEEKRETLQQWWRLVSEILEETAKFPRSSQVTMPILPGPMLIRLKIIAQEIAYGRNPELIKDANGRGKLSTYGERRDRAIAGAYRRAVDEKGIDDHKPSETVADHFGLADTRSVTRFANNEKLIEEFRNLDLLSPKSLTRMLHEAGERYKKYGPTQSAIQDRARGDSKEQISSHPDKLGLGDIDGNQKNETGAYHAITKPIRATSPTSR